MAGGAAVLLGAGTAAAQMRLKETATATPAPTAAPTAQVARPFYYDRKIELADLEGRTLRELSIVRNTIFARHGKAFQVRWIAEHFDGYDWYEPGHYDQSKISKRDLHNAAIVARYEASIPTQELARRRDALLAAHNGGQTWADEDQIEVLLLSRALGKPIHVGDVAWWRERRTPLEEPALLDEVISAKGLGNMSRRDLRILRNTIYARHGRPFKSEILQEYFDRMEWYRIDPHYSDQKLTKVDRRNIQIVLSVEKERGGPLTEGQHRRAEEADFMAGA